MLHAPLQAADRGVNRLSAFRTMTSWHVTPIGFADRATSNPEHKLTTEPEKVELLYTTCASLAASIDAVPRTCADVTTCMWSLASSTSRRTLPDIGYGTMRRLVHSEKMTHGAAGTLIMCPAPRMATQPDNGVAVELKFFVFC